MAIDMNQEKLQAKKSVRVIVKELFKRYFIDAMGAMALGLFASLIIGLIISQLAKIPFLGFINKLNVVIGYKAAAEGASAITLMGASSPVIGSAIGVAIAYGLKTALFLLRCHGERLVTRRWSGRSVT